MKHRIKRDKSNDTWQYYWVFRCGICEFESHTTRYELAVVDGELHVRRWHDFGSMYQREFGNEPRIRAR